MSETSKEAQARGAGIWFILIPLSFLWSVIRQPIRALRDLL